MTNADYGLVKRLIEWLRKRGEPDSGIRYRGENSWQDAEVILHGSDATFIADNFHGEGARALADRLDALSRPSEGVEDTGVGWTVYDWAYTTKDGHWSYARTPERAEALVKQGVALTPVYTPFPSLEAVKRVSAAPLASTPAADGVREQTTLITEIVNGTAPMSRWVGSVDYSTYDGFEDYLKSQLRDKLTLKVSLDKKRHADNESENLAAFVDGGTAALEGALATYRTVRERLAALASPVSAEAAIAGTPTDPVSGDGVREALQGFMAIAEKVVDIACDHPSWDQVVLSEEEVRLIPDSVLARQFPLVAAKWPGAMLTTYTEGRAVLSVPRVELITRKFDRMHATFAAILPAGYPMAQPDHFYIDSELRCADGNPLGAIVSGLMTEHPKLPGFRRFSNSMVTWNPNTDNLYTVVNFMRVSLARLSDWGLENAV